MTSPKLTVEIHDVTPAQAEECRELRLALAGLGIERPTLLVVPRWESEHGRRFDLREHPAFVEWLRHQQSEGAEIVLHGLTHRAPAAPPPGLRNAFMHHVFSRGCNEFAHLERAQADARLRLGRHILEECGLAAEGFVAPAWEQSPAALQAVRAQGFRFTAFFNKVLPLMRGTGAVPTPALTFDAAHPLVDWGKRRLMRLMEWLSRDAPLLRIALHPADVHGSRPLPHILERVRILKNARRLVTYREWLDEEPGNERAA